MWTLHGKSQGAAGRVAQGYNRGGDKGGSFRRIVTPFVKNSSPGRMMLDKAAIRRYCGILDLYALARMHDADLYPSPRTNPPLFPSNSATLATHIILRWQGIARRLTLLTSDEASHTLWVFSSGRRRRYLTHLNNDFKKRLQVVASGWLNASSVLLHKRSVLAVTRLFACLLVLWDRQEKWPFSDKLSVTPL